MNLIEIKQDKNDEKAHVEPKKVDNSSKNVSAPSTTKANGNNNNLKSSFKTNEVKKGNYSSMDGFAIVPKTIVTKYQKKIGDYHDYLYQSS